MERADQILAVGGIDRGLAADRGIDLRQQRGRHLHVIEPAPHHRGGEAGEVADDAAAERDDEIAALDARRDDLPRRPARIRESFSTPSPAGTITRLDAIAPAGERGFGSGRAQTRATFSSVTIATLAPGRNAAMRVAERSDESAADHDVIAAVAERDTDGCRIGAKRCSHAPSFSSVEAGASQERAERRDDVGDDRVVRHFARVHGQVGQRVGRLALGQQSRAGFLPDRRSAAAAVRCGAC